MNISAVLTKNYNNEQRTMNYYSKQTQSNPISKAKNAAAFDD